MADEKIIEIEEGICPYCYGKGTVEENQLIGFILFFYNPIYSSYQQKQCPVCLGKGAQRFIHYGDGHYRRETINKEANIGE